MLLLQPSDKVKKLIEWGVKPYRLSKFTGIPANTIQYIWNGKTPVENVKLENAEKLAEYYDLTEKSLSEAIATCDYLMHLMDDDRIAFTGNAQLHAKVMREPYKVFEKLHTMVMDPKYAHLWGKYQVYLNEIERCLNNIDSDIVYEITLSPMFELYIAAHRHKLRTLHKENAAQ